MAVNQHKPLSPATIEEDRASLLALKELNDYAPANPGITTDAVDLLEGKLRQAEETEILAGKGLKAARGARIAAEWALHNAMLGVKAAVIGQYGPNSDAMQSLGLKKKTNYRRPSRRRDDTSS